MAQREKVFLDIGAHNGRTAAAVLGGDWPFDRIISVEPDRDMVAVLEARFADHIASGRYRVAPIGLSNGTGSAKLFGDNSGGGASLLSSKFGHDNRASRDITLLDWSTFASQYRLDAADLYVKINCEGAEVAIIDSLLDHGADNVKSLVVDFDIVKTPFGGWKKWRSVRRLRAAAIPYLLSEEVFFKSPKTGARENWLNSLPDLVDAPTPRIPPPFFRVLRVRYLEVVSALGVRPDLFKRRKR